MPFRRKMVVLSAKRAGDPGTITGGSDCLIVSLSRLTCDLSVTMYFFLVNPSTQMQLLYCMLLGEQIYLDGGLKPRAKRCRIPD